MNKINWKDEAEIINMYADYEVKPNKEDVVDYLEFIVSLNGYQELFCNERSIIKKLIKKGEWIK